MEKSKEGVLLRALTERGELTPTAAAMRTSLTIEEASKMLDELAGKGHLKVQTEDGIVAFGLRERDRPPAPGKVETSPERVSQNCTDLARLEVPLSEREALTLLASGRTNSEIARTLFVAVGTVKFKLLPIHLAILFAVVALVVVARLRRRSEQPSCRLSWTLAIHAA